MDLIDMFGWECVTLDCEWRGVNMKCFEGCSGDVGRVECRMVWEKVGRPGHGNLVCV